MSDIVMTDLPRIRPYVPELDLERLQGAAAADAHQVVAPTHVVERHGQIVGYGSLAGLPTLHMWLDSQRVRARESLMILNTYENLLAAAGAKVVLMPCDPKSPFYPFLDGLGYARLGTTTLNLKKVS